MSNKHLAREMRNNPTSQEKTFWSIVKNRQFFGYRFLRQYCIGNYIVDFICKEKKIVIEIDGSQHTEFADYDNERTQYLNSLGYKIVRFWNNEIDNDIEGVYSKMIYYFEIND